MPRSETAVATRGNCKKNSVIEGKASTSVYARSNIVVKDVEIPGSLEIGVHADRMATEENHNPRYQNKQKRHANPTVSRLSPFHTLFPFPPLDCFYKLFQPRASRASNSPRQIFQKSDNLPPVALRRYEPRYPSS